MTTFNGKSKGFINKTIKSVLNQTHKNFELIIVDDGSSDHTKEYIKEIFDDERIIYIYQQNSGVSNARNCGIKLAKYDFICILDDDDIWVENKLEIQLDAFNKNPNWMMQYSAIERITSEENHINFQYHEARNNFYQQMVYKNLVDATSSVMIKKFVFDTIGLFADIPQGAEDYEMWVRIAKNYEIGSSSKALVKYRVHKQNDSKNIKKIEIGLLAALKLITSNDSSLDKNKIFYNGLLNLANKAFELESYLEFRELTQQLSQYGTIKISTQIKYYLSYCPIFIDLLRKIK